MLHNQLKFLDAISPMIKYCQMLGVLYHNPHTKPIYKSLILITKLTYIIFINVYSFIYDEDDQGNIDNVDYFVYCAQKLTMLMISLTAWFTYNLYETTINKIYSGIDNCADLLSTIDVHCDYILEKKLAKIMLFCVNVYLIGILSLDLSIYNTKIILVLLVFSIIFTRHGFQCLIYIILYDFKQKFYLINNKFQNSMRPSEDYEEEIKICISVYYKLCLMCHKISEKCSCFLLFTVFHKMSCLILAMYILNDMYTAYTDSLYFRIVYSVWFIGLILELLIQVYFFAAVEYEVRNDLQLNYF